MYDVDATELIEEVSKELQKVEGVKAPDWAVFVKTGVHKERPPARQDWWYVRAASVLRKVRLMGPIGVAKLRGLYGGKQSRGYKSEVYKKGSGSIIRKILQQLEKAELVKKDKKGFHKGRIITPKGIKLINGVAKKLVGNKPIVKKAEVKKEEIKVKEKPKTTETKTEEMVKKTKEFAEGKVPTAEKLVEEAKKEKKPEVPKAVELAKKNG